MLDARFDCAYDRFGVRAIAVDREPAWALRNEAAREEHRETERCADREPDTPADVDRENRRVEQHDGCRRTRHGAEPEASVDDEVHATAYARRNELVDRGIDRRVLAADAEAGERAEKTQRQEIRRERSEHRAREVDAHRDEEEARAAVSVGEMPAEERTDHRPDEVRRC